MLNLQTEDALDADHDLIPDDCKPLAEAVEQLVISATRARHRTRGGRAVDYAQIEREVGERTAAIERATHQSLLAGLDVDAPTVVIDGRVHTRVHRAEGRYDTMAGDVVVPRSLYRAARNGPVVDAISLRAGAVDADGCRKRRRRSHTCYMYAYVRVSN